MIYFTDDWHIVYLRLADWLTIVYLIGQFFVHLMETFDLIVELTRQ